MIGNLPVFRGALDRLLIDTGTVTSPGEGDPVFNEETGQYDPPPPVVHYTGRMLVRPDDATGNRESGPATATYVLTRYEVTLPAGTEVFRDQTLTVTSSTYDPMLEGRPMTLIDVKMDSYQLARRCVAERVG